MINVTDADITYAEKILLKEGQSFDDERRAFIKDLTTLDLQAVPGSGKTTALLAKLLILEKYMPLKNGVGVLVLSHTNAAVDEIYSKIGKYAPKLFRYPNFIGTIQSFVDTFLAIPYYSNKHKKKPYRIDNEIYNEKIEKCLSNLWYYKYDLPKDTLKHIAHIKNANESVFYNYRFQIDEDRVFLTKALNEAELQINKPRGNTKKQNYQDYSVVEKKNIYEWFKRFKVGILVKEEVLHFDDAYFLAKLHIKRHPNIVNLLQKRFHFTFVDEMQDMDIHQHDLLESIFFENGASSSIFQRIGDINQAIYNGNSVHINEIWSQRTNTLQIRGSHRINNRLAPIIERLGLTSYEILGLNKNDDGTEIDIKPHILVFDDSTKENVIPRFAEIIIQLQAEGKIPSPSKHKFMAIAWRKEHEDSDKLGLSDYWNNYSVSNLKTKIDYKVLKDYLLFYDRTKDTLESIRKQVLNALLKILRLESIFDDNNRVYSKQKLLNDLKEHHNEESENLKLLIYKWSISCINDKIEDVYLSIKEYVPNFLSLFGKTMINSQEFIDGASAINIEQIEIIEHSNFYETDDIRIEIGTVHSVKGKTHTATLYLETFFQGKYESEYLKNMFLNNSINKNGVYIKQAMKMCYVGFSRPTHLLCVAIHMERFERVLADIDRGMWEIIDLSTT
ncbi:MAG: UvrD-helicase domain-containing protein [Bacteroidia bacterium]|nr:UvrD-helicase domain-containing protein [Bacteroidia bacterium]